MNSRRINVWVLEDKVYAFIEPLEGIFGKNNFELQLCVCLTSALKSISEVRQGKRKRPDVLLFDVGVPVVNSDITARRQCAMYLSDTGADWQNGEKWYSEYVTDEDVINEFEEYLRKNKELTTINRNGEDCQVGIPLAMYCLDALPGVKMMVYSGQADYAGLRTLRRQFADVIHFWGKDPASCPDWPDIVDHIADSHIRIGDATLAPALSLLENAKQLSGKGKTEELTKLLRKLQLTALSTTKAPGVNSAWTFGTLLPIRMNRLMASISNKGDFQEECSEIVSKFGDLMPIKIPKRGIWSKAQWQNHYMSVKKGTRWSQIWDGITRDVETFLQRYYSEPEQDGSLLNKDNQIPRELVGADLRAILTDSQLAAVMKHRLLVLDFLYSSGKDRIDIQKFYDKVGMERGETQSSDKYYLTSILGFPCEVGPYQREYYIRDPELTTEEDEWIAERYTYTIDEEFPNLISLLGKLSTASNILRDPKGSTIKNVSQLLQQYLNTNTSGDAHRKVQSSVANFLTSSEAQGLLCSQKTSGIVHLLKEIAGTS